jgi:hypothetical protein
MTKYKNTLDHPLITGGKFIKSGGIIEDDGSRGKVYTKSLIRLVNKKVLEVVTDDVDTTVRPIVARVVPAKEEVAAIEDVPEATSNETEEQEVQDGTDDTTDAPVKKTRGRKAVTAVGDN